MLAAAAVLGGLIGEASFHVWRLTYPTFTSTAVLEAEPIRTNLTSVANEFNQEETEVYIATRLQDFDAQNLLERVVSSPKL
ncbi:MAG: hypothetical protein AAF235_01290, partial [Planctomycetota bacterium]